MPKDLTGQRFGKLSVLGPNPDPYISPAGKKTRRWNCRCDCGTELVVLQNCLTGKNGTRSCGCTRSDKTRGVAHDMTGQKFGRLTVIGPAELDKPQANGQKLGWRCRCDCGVEIVTTRKSLLGGLKSCGCLLSETARKKIEGQNVIGYYAGTVISAIRPSRAPNKNNHSGVKGVYWNSREQRWIARIGVQGKSITIGRFKALEDAAKERKDAEEKYFSPLIDEYERETKK